MENQQETARTERSLSRNLLPARVQDLVRKIKAKPTLNDLVERVYLELYEDERFHRFLDATSDEDTVEGSQAADNLEAANMIRDWVRENEPANPLANKKKHTISIHLGVVVRRYGDSRKERHERLRQQDVTQNGGDE